MEQSRRNPLYKLFEYSHSAETLVDSVEEFSPLVLETEPLEPMKILSPLVSERTPLE